MDAFLVGASGGVYALLAGHLANILLVSTGVSMIWCEIFVIAGHLANILLVSTGVSMIVRDYCSIETIVIGYFGNVL